MNFKEISIGANIRDVAVEHSKNRIRYEYDRFNLNTEQRLSMITLGTLGQLVLQNYLECKEVDFDFQLQFGKYDDFDFSINNQIIEVKCSGYKKIDEWKSLHGIYNASQLENALLKNFYCSVQIFVNGYDKVNKLLNVKNCTTAIIAGWIKINEIKNFPKKFLPFGPAYLIPLDQLKDVDLLLS